MKHEGYNNNVSSLGNSTAQKFKYNGKELQDELGLNWYDLGARNHDPTIGRFMNLDPLAEDYNYQSTYAFATNNPIYYVDINGEGVQDDYGLDTETGELVLIKITDENTDTIYTGTTDSNGNFEKDGKRKTFSKEASNIKDVAGYFPGDGDPEATPETSNDISQEGLTFNEGYEQVGLEVMEFISFSSEIELNAWGFTNENGDGLSISAWSENNSYESKDYQDKNTNSVIEVSTGRRLGAKKAKVHTHPGRKGDLYAGRGDASPDDRRNRNKGQRSKYPHFINSKYDGWTSY